LVMNTTNSLESRQADDSIHAQCIAAKQQLENTISKQDADITTLKELISL